MRSGGNSSMRRPSPRRCGAPSAMRAPCRQRASPSTCWGRARAPMRMPTAIFGALWTQSAPWGGRSARAAIWRGRLEVSVKLSSIHPRYDAASYAQVRGELLDRLKQISGRAAAAGVGLTIDAEGSESLSLQLDLFEALAADRALDRWGGLGLAVQAYQLRALGTVDALLEIAGRRRKRGGMPIAVRLVKGAYWDAEVKRAQE